MFGRGGAARYLEFEASSNLKRREKRPATKREARGLYLHTTLVFHDAFLNGFCVLNLRLSHLGLPNLLKALTKLEKSSNGMHNCD